MEQFKKLNFDVKHWKIGERNIMDYEILKRTLWNMKRYNFFNILKLFTLNHV